MLERRTQLQTEKLVAGSKLRKETGVSHLQAVVEASQTPRRGIYCTLRTETGLDSGATLFSLGENEEEMLEMLWKTFLDGMEHPSISRMDDSVQKVLQFLDKDPTIKCLDDRKGSVNIQSNQASPFDGGYSNEESLLDNWILHHDNAVSHIVFELLAKRVRQCSPSHHTTSNWHQWTSFCSQGVGCWTSSANIDTTPKELQLEIVDLQSDQS
ncbi:hypothetical protein TNCV_4136141 [Trichonephila clavipes]|nr:hypothetical protein TNCV_4136141 [Trichonephila clavipes]